MELGQRFLLVWTLIVCCAVVFTNGDIIGSPGDIRKGYNRLQAPAEVDTNTEEPKGPRGRKTSNIIVQPVQEVGSKGANRQTDPPLAPRPAKDDGPESDDSNVANGVVASDRDTKVSKPRVSPPKNPGEQKGDTQDPKSANAAKNLAFRLAGKRKPKHVSPQAIPLQNVVVQPIYAQSDPRLGNPRFEPSSNVGNPTGSNFAVQSSNQQQYTGENLQSTPLKKTQPRYGFYIARAEPSPPNHGAVQSGPVGNSQSSHRPIKPSHAVPSQRAWDQGSYYSNPGSNFPLRTIAIQQQQPQYEQNAWVELPVQPPHIQPVYVQSSNLGIPNIEAYKDVVIRPGYGQGYYDGISPSGPLGNVPVQRVYEGSSAFGRPGYEPTRTIAIQPGYGQDSEILKFNPPANFKVLPKYEPSFRAGIPQPNPPDSPSGQSAIEQNHQVTNPRPNPIANPARPANEPDPRARLSPGYPTINISFLRGYEPPNLRAEQPQSIPSGAAVQPATIVPSQPATNPAVQPTQETLYPKEGIPQPDVPKESGSSFVPNQEEPPRFPEEYLENPELWEGRPHSVQSSQRYVPINSQLPAQPPTNPAVQPTRGNVNSREGTPQPVAPIEFGTGSVPNQKAPFFFPTDILDKPQYHQASPLVGSAQWYVPVNSQLPAQPYTNPAIQPTRGNLNAREGIPQPAAPIEFGTGSIPNQKAPFFFPTDILDKPEYHQASPLVGSAQWYVPINSQLPAQPSANPAVQPTRGNLNSREGIPQPVAPIEFGTGFVPNQKAPVFFPTDILEKPEYPPASPLIGSSQWYVPIDREIPSEQRSMSSHRETQAVRKIALQSGHAKPFLKVIATETTPPREVLVQSGYGQLHCHLKFVPQSNFAVSVPKDSTLESELQRNKDLHQLVMSQLNSMQKQPQALHPQETLGGKGSKKKKNEWGTTPLFLRSINPPQCTGRNQYPRSLNSESGPNGGHGQPVWNYPETSSIGRVNISQAVNSIIPKVNATLNSFLNSTLNGIRPQQEQGNRTNLITGITTGIADTAKTLEKKVTDVISPILGSQINGDPQKNPNNSQSPQASPSNVSQNGHQGAYDQRFAPFPKMNSPNDLSKFVNEYGRNVMDVLPSTLNSAVDNSNAYLKGFYDNLKGYVP